MNDMNDMLDAEPTLWLGYHHRGRDITAIRIADTLATAVKFQIPILDALRRLQDEVYTSSAISRFLDKQGWDVTSRCLVFMWLPSVRLSVIIKRLIGDLTGGMPLSQAIERRMGARLPRYYVLALQKAEKENQLEVVLPLLANRIQYQRSVVDDRWPYLPLLIFQIAVILFVFFGQKVFIFPVLVMMPRSFSQQPVSLAMALMAGVTSAIVWAFGLGLVAFIISRSEKLREGLLPWIPGIAAEKRRLLVRDLAQSMGVFLSTGADVVTAAAWSLKATTSPWLKPRLESFVNRVTSGENWGSAWDKMQLGERMYPWLIVNAAARQDPLGGFECLAEWLHQDISCTTRFVRRWFTPCVVILLGLCVLTIAGTFFGLLTGMSKVFFLR